MRVPYGVGLAYRSCLHREVMQHRQAIDLLEIPTEDYLVRRRRIETDESYELLREVTSTFPCVAHGISLSVGSVEPLDESYLAETSRLMREFGIPIFSEHLAFHRLDGVDLTLFLSMPFDDVSVAWLERNCSAVQAALQCPIVLENVSYEFAVPASGMSEAEFLTRVVEATGCSLLLDVTNVFNNAHNHGYDPLEFLENLPGDQVSQLHIAGGHYLDGRWLDSHSMPVVDEVWQLLEATLQQTAAQMVILERDSNFVPFDPLLEELGRAREIFYRHRPLEPTTEMSATAMSSSAPLAHASSLEISDPQLAELQAYQRSILKRITDAEFASQFEQDPTAALRFGPLSPQWLERLQNCDQQQLAALAHKWEDIKQCDALERQRFENLEWDRWSKKLGHS